MADNTTLSTGTGGDTIATDDIGGVKYPRSKIVIGADGANDGDISAANPLPVTGTGIAGTANAGVVTVQGIASMTPVQVADNGGSLTVDGAVAATQSGTWTVQPGNTANSTAWLVTGTGGSFPVTDSAGSLTIDAPVGNPVFVRLSDGTAAISALPVTDNGTTLSIDDGGASLTVDGSVAVSGSVTVANAGTFAVQLSAALPAGTNGIGKLTANSGVTIGAVEIAASQTLATVTTVATVTTCATVTTLTGGGVAHDAADSGNPHKIGARATASLSGGTNVAADDRTDLKAAVDGALLVRGVALEDVVTGTPVGITDGASTSVLSAQGANTKIYVTDVTIANSSTTDVTVDLRDGTAGAVKWTFPVPQTGGVTHRFGTPLPFSANTAVAADPSAAASTVTVSVCGFKSKI